MEPAGITERCHRHAQRKCGSAYSEPAMRPPLQSLRAWSSVPLRPMSSTGFTVRAFAIATIFFVGIAPTLSRQQFSGGSENLVVGSVLEMQRGGPWLIPTLRGAPRTTKPPLTTWLCAVTVSPSTVSALSDRSKREEAYRELAREVRWPALAASCLTVVAAAWLGRVLACDAVGLAAAAIMGSTLMFQRFGREITTDVYLALWVTTANLFLALALFEARKWLGCLLGGAALGLALMSKGPVALVQTVAPLLALMAWRWWTGRARSEQRTGWAPVIAGALVMLAIALPWPIWVLTRMSGQIGYWWGEMTAGGVADYHRDSVWSYASLIPLMLPWTGFLFLGAIFLFRDKTERSMLALLLLIAPIVVMSCFSEKNERYLLPMLAPAAVICAAGFVRRLDRDAKRAWDIIAVCTAITVLVIGLGLPIAGATFLKQSTGASWWSVNTALFAAAVSVVIFIFARSVFESRRSALIVGGMAIMTWVQAVFVYGYSTSTRGRSAAKPVMDTIAATLPADATVYCYAPKGRFSRVPSDVPIYLNRIVWPTIDTDARRASATPTVLLVFCRAGESLPASVSDWRTIGTFEENNGTWSACIPPPR
jgi:4-amino-4-deoxy-L-arabinose transferase-like glycosyltransferase